MEIRILAIAIVLFGGCRPASADSISYNLFVTATTGPLAGQSATGAVTFDSSIIPEGGGKVVGQHLFTDVDFEWDNISYTASNTETSSLQFDSHGMLTQWDFGTACIPNGGGCLVRLIAPGFEDWVVKNEPTNPLFFEYGRPDLSFGFGKATLTATPEPITAGLMATGLAGLCVGRYRRRR
jgi:hypothetical protein